MSQTVLETALDINVERRLNAIVELKVTIAISLIIHTPVNEKCHYMVQTVLSIQLQIIIRLISYT